MKLDPMEDLDINVNDLTQEFKKLSLLLYRYYQQKAEAEREHDRMKSLYEEMRAKTYKDLKNGGVKHTEKSLEAELDSDQDLVQLYGAVLDQKRELNIWIGAVESMKTKSNMLIQLGSDRRKEL